MVNINPIILDTLKKVIEEDPKLPKDLESLINDLLKIEKNSGASEAGIDKLYDQILEKRVDNKELIEWSKSYDK